ncbi:MAG: AraC family transcriptional regulator [Planctomycetota bacterium]
MSGVIFAEIDYPPGSVFGPRVQGDLQLFMVERGSAVVTTDGIDQEVRPGQVVCQWPGGLELFTFDKTEETVHRWITFSLADWPGPDQRERVARLRRSSPAIREEGRLMRRVFELGYSTVPDRRKSDSVSLIQLGLAYLVDYLSGDDLESVKAERLPQALTAMRRTIDTRYAEALTLDDLAASASVSGPHLARLCRRHLDTTPLRLLWDTRIDHGLTMLRDTGLSVAEAAYRVGFASPFHFSRLVKARTGEAPRDYRRRVWAVDEPAEEP